MDHAFTINARVLGPGGTSGVIMQPATGAQRDGFVDVLWEGAESDTATTHAIRELTLFDGHHTSQPQPTGSQNVAVSLGSCATTTSNTYSAAQLEEWATILDALNPNGDQAGAGMVLQGVRQAIASGDNSMLRTLGGMMSEALQSGDLSMPSFTGPSPTAATSTTASPPTALLTEIAVACSPFLHGSNNPTGRLFVGDFVVRGPSWRTSVHGEQDGGKGCVGVISSLSSDAGIVDVRWRANDSTGRYKYTPGGMQEVSLVLMRCPTQSNVSHRHWIERVASVPTDRTLADFKCKYCAHSLSLSDIATRPPFFCEHCLFCVCLTCLHTREPPIKAWPIKIRFSHTQNQRIFREFFPTATLQDIDANLRLCDGDLTLAIVKYDERIPRAVIRPTPPSAPRHDLIQLMRWVLEGQLDRVKSAFAAGLDVNVTHTSGRTALHVASGVGMFHIAEYLVNEAKADVNAPDEDGDGPLAHCAQEGSVPIAELLLKAGANPNMTSSNSLSPLMRACLNGRPELVDLLINSGALIDQQDSNGNTSVHLAVTHGHPRCLEVLIKHKANLNAMNRANFTPLHECGKDKSLRCCDLLIENGGDLTMFDEKGRMPIHTAAAFNCSSVIERILDKDPSQLNAVDHELDTPLHIACKITQTRRDVAPATTRGCEAANVLISRGADVFLEGSNVGVLHLAAASGMVSTCELLISKGVDMNIRASRNGQTPLHAAVSRHNHGVISFLVSAGANINAVDSDGDSVLHFACGLILSKQHSDIKTIRLLVDLKASPDLRTFKNGRNCLMQCKLSHATANDSVPRFTPLLFLGCLNGKLDIVKMLVQSGNADVALKDEEGDDSIQFALGTNDEYSEIVSVLLGSSTANPFSQNKKLRTALHRAASKGFLSSIRMILAHSACTEDCVNMCDQYCDTALHDAATRGFEDVARVLIQHGADPMIRNSSGKTVLDIAKGKPSMRELMILAHSACTEDRVNMCDQYCDTALHDAVTQALEDVVLIAVEHGADPIIKNSSDNLQRGEFASFEGTPDNEFASLGAMQSEPDDVNGSATQISYTKYIEELNFESLSASKQARIVDFIKGLNEEVESPPSNVTVDVPLARAPSAASSCLDINRIKWEDLEVEGSEPIGQGSFGVVIKARYYKAGKRVGMSTQVAVKLMMKMAIALDYDDICIKTWREANTVHHAWKCAHHDCVVKLFGVVEGPLPAAWTDVLPYKVPPGNELGIGIVMNFESGGSLEDVLYKTDGVKPDMREKVRILLGIACGLTEMHSATAGYIVHGDIKPGNILLSHHSPPTVRLADFGMSQVRKSVSASISVPAACSTRPRGGGGTIKYSAPELSDVDGTTSRSADMYAFGIMAWEVLSGTRPFPSMTDTQACVQMVQGVRPDISKLPDNTAPGLRSMIEDCWNQDRTKRMSAGGCYAALCQVYSCLCSEKFDIFFSHPWKDKSLLRHVFKSLTNDGYRVWYDEHEMGWDIYKSMEQGVKKSYVVIACVNEKYQESPNCMKELRDASLIPDKPIISLITQTGHSIWANGDLTDLCDFSRRMYVEIGKAAEMGEWDSPDGPTAEMLAALKEQLQPLFKLLNDMQCPHSLNDRDDSSCSSAQAALQRGYSIRTVSSLSSNSI